MLARCLSLCVLIAGVADAQVSSTRVSDADWQCQDAAGERISNHQRFDTAFIACLSHPDGALVQGGRYRINRATSPAPTDSDGDGVPDPADECSTVHAATPDGCPATPPEPEPELERLPAPENLRAQGASTSRIRVEWDAVDGATAYSLERCIGETCTTFSQLLCVPNLFVIHSYLPPALTASYRVRASRDADCSAAVGNLGEYSSIVNGTSNPAPEPATGEALLSWVPPSENTDGSAITDLAGYRIAYGTSAGALTQSIQVASPTPTSYRVEDLAPGTYYFAVRAYTSGGAESELSNVVSKAIQQ